MATVERSHVIDEARPPDFTKAGALQSGDFAGQARVGSLARNTANGVLYICTATDGSTSATWAIVGTQQ